MGFDATDNVYCTSADRDRRRMRPEDRCSALYDAALAVFANGGYSSASLNDIAEQAGVTKGCLYHYFDSKETLLLSLIRARLAPPSTEIYLGISCARTREEAIGLLVRKIWSHFQQPGQLELMTLAFAELPKNPGVARVLFEESISHARRLIQQAIRSVSCETRLTDRDEDAIAVVIPSLIMGVAIGHRLFRDIEPNPVSEETLERTIAGILDRGL